MFQTKRDIYEDMKIVSITKDKNESIYTVELEPEVYVDVKRIESHYYIMQCEDGYEVFDDNGNTFDYFYDKEIVIRFIKESEHYGSFK